MRRPLVLGNWKMNGSQAAATSLLNGLLAAKVPDSIELGVCPPFVHIALAAAKLEGSAFAWGAQNCSSEEKGAYTGEVSVSMLADLACTYVLAGHSERRGLYAESDKMVADKVSAIIAAGLSPVLCVGETLGERDSGLTLSVVERQLLAVLDQLKAEELASLVLAYEPVWAIGTGRTASPSQAQEVHVFLRSLVVAKDEVLGAGVRLLYGGSVKPDNAVELFAQADIDGGLIGGAALQASDFLAIGMAAAEKAQ